MKENFKYILAIIVALAVLIVVSYFVFNKPAKVTHSTSNTKTVTTESITTVQNTFTIEQVAQIKKVLTDSLRNVYGAIINRLIRRGGQDDHTLNPSSYEGDGDSTNLSPYSYVSEVDSNIVVKDSSGSITDMFKVKSTFISPVLLAENSLHLLRLNHTSFRKGTKTDSKTSDTVYVNTTKNFWERFTISPNISAGYGLFNKQFDIYTGVGFSFEFNAFEIFSHK
jgi:hypothetical protein